MKSLPRTTAVNIKFDTYDQYIGRSGHGYDGYFGNKYRGSTLGGGVAGRNEAIARFKHEFMCRIAQDIEFSQRVVSLRGKRLGCFCKEPLEKVGRIDIPCHGDVYVEFLDSLKCEVCAGDAYYVAEGESAVFLCAECAA